MKRWIMCSVVASLMVANTALAKDVEEGVVVQTDNGEIVVDVGSDDGLRASETVWVYRRLTVTHPVTKKKIEDRFPIGSLTLDQVGEKLSIATNPSTLTRPPKPGDFVVFVPPEVEETKEAAPTQPGAPKSTERSAFERAFQETLGRSIQDRIDTWTRYLNENPESPWVDEVLNELHWLRVTQEQRREDQRRVADEPRRPDASPKPNEPVPVEEAPTGVEASAYSPLAVEAGMDVPFALTVTEPERVDRVRLHVRNAGAPVYSTYDLGRNGDYSWTAELDGDEWDEVGRLEYFAEVIRTDGNTETVEPFGSDGTVRVEEPPTDPVGEAGRSQARMVGEYVNFKADEGDDEYVRFEAKYRYHIGVPILRGFTAGVGMFRGAGGPTETIETGENTRTMLLSYGFAETDFEFFDYVGINTRLLLGNNQQLGIGETVFRSAFGLSGELRFGEAEKTRLLLGAAFTETVGAESWITLHLHAIDRVPMNAEVVVTNLPVGEDLGVSLNYSAGYAFTDWFTLMGRVGWNARTITHHGPTAGLATVFNW